MYVTVYMKDMFSIEPLCLINVLSITLPYLDSADVPYENRLNDYLNELDTCMTNHMVNPVGPLIMKTFLINNDNIDPQFVGCYLQQTDSFIHELNEPFSMEEKIEIQKCIYRRYEGQEKGLLYVFSEIQTYLKEQGIGLSGEIYTVFISQDEKTDTIVAELFLPIKE